MWDTAAIVLGSFIGGVALTLVCVFMNTVVDDIRNSVKGTNSTLILMTNQLTIMSTDAKTKHDMVLHEMDKLQKDVKALRIETLPNHSEPNLDSRSI
jgi:uncharacterized protein YoxC